MNKLTPNLIVEGIEACLPFWTERLGFERTVEVPQGERLGFVILKRGPVEVMLQSRASLATDVAPIADGPHPLTCATSRATRCESMFASSAALRAPPTHETQPIGGDSCEIHVCIICT